MKKVIKTLIFLCFFLIVTMLKAQVTVGFRVGANVATVKTYYYSEPSTVLFTAGVPLEVRINKLFALQTGLNFTQKGFKTAQYRDVASWLETDLLGKLRLGGDKLIHGFVFFGPSLGFNLTERSKYTSSYDISLNLGGQIVMDAVFIDLRYQYGMTDLDTFLWQNNRAVGRHNRGLAITFGFNLKAAKKEIIVD
jgi:Outer membrane protein beta-barrel domain